MKKIIAILLIIFIIILLIASYLYFNEDVNINNSEENTSIDINENNKKYLYINDNMIEDDTNPLYYGSYIEINENTIAYNSIYEDYATLTSINLNNLDKFNITNLIDSSYIYKGIYRYSDNILTLYYIDNNICDTSGIVGTIYYIDTSNNTYTLLPNKDELTKESFLDNFSYYCEYYK